MKAVALFQNDGAIMTADKSAIFAGEKFIRTCYGSDIRSQKYFEDPSLCIDLALLDGKEDLTLIHSMSKNIFRGYQKSRGYDLICGKNLYVKSEGLFPEAANNSKNRQCVACDKYGLANSRVQRQNIQRTRLVWVHPSIEVFLKSCADFKNVCLQFNIKSS